MSKTSRGAVAAQTIAVALAVAGCSSAYDDSQVTVTETVNAVPPGVGELETHEAEKPEQAPEGADVIPTDLVNHPRDGHALSDDMARILFANVPLWKDADSEMLTEWSDGVCLVYDTNLEPQIISDTLFQESRDSGLDSGQVSASILIGTGWRCPEHWSEAERIVEIATPTRSETSAPAASATSATQDSELCANFEAQQLVNERLHRDGYADDYSSEWEALLEANGCL